MSVSSLLTSEGRQGAAASVLIQKVVWVRLCEGIVLEDSCCFGSFGCFGCQGKLSLKEGYLVAY